MEQVISKIEKVVNGELAATEVYAELLSEQEFIESCIARVKPFVLQELSNYTEKEVKLCGVTWQKKTAPGKWDFSNIPSWNAAKGKIKSLEEMAKQKYKAQEKGQDMFLADENGEEIPTPIYTSGSETFAVLKK